MIKIISHGNTYIQPKKLEFICAYCGCEFTADREDYTIEDDMGYMTARCECPECEGSCYSNPYIGDDEEEDEEEIYD